MRLVLAGMTRINRYTCTRLHGSGRLTPICIAFPSRSRCSYRSHWCLPSVRSVPASPPQPCHAPLLVVEHCSFPSFTSYYVFLGVASCTSLATHACTHHSILPYVPLRVQKKSKTLEIGDEYKETYCRKAGERKDPPQHQPNCIQFLQFHEKKKKKGASESRETYHAHTHFFSPHGCTLLPCCTLTSVLVRKGE